MMKLSVAAVLFGLVLYPPASAQEHAILPEQCRADVHLWISQTKEDNNRLLFSDLQRRSLEMWNCLCPASAGNGESVHPLR
jgi:hypothetical protein